MLSVPEAAAILRAGGLVAFPTETLVGLGCDARNAEACARIVALKGRAPDQPFPLLLPRSHPLDRYAVVTPASERLARRFWPGTLTLVLPAGAGCPPDWRAVDGTVALRRSAHPIAAALVDALDAPLVATSANRSGAPAPREMSELDPVIAAGVQGQLEQGLPGSGRGSTIVRVADDGTWQILREGHPTAAELEDTLAAAGA